MRAQREGTGARTSCCASAPGRFPLGRAGDPKELAAAVAFLVSERASFITGVALPGRRRPDPESPVTTAAAPVDREGITDIHRLIRRLRPPHAGGRGRRRRLRPRSNRRARPSSWNCSSTPARSSPAAPSPICWRGQVPPAGVVAASGGNHGAAVAFAAMRLGVPARIFVPTVASPVKLDQIKSYGADLVVEGERYADALAASERWVVDLRRHGRSMRTIRWRRCSAPAPSAPSWRSRRRSWTRSRRGRRRRTDRRHGRVVRRRRTEAPAGRCRAGAGAHAHPRARRGPSGRRRSRRHRGRLAGAAAGRRADVPHRADSTSSGSCWSPTPPFGPRRNRSGGSSGWWRSPVGPRRSPRSSPGRTGPQEGERVGVVVCGGNTTAVDFGR